jgi:hypothetical protein
MDKVNVVFDQVCGFVGKLTNLLLAVLSLAIIAQVLTTEAVFGMDVIGNVVAIIDKLGNAGVVGIIAIVALFAIVSKKE